MPAEIVRDAAPLLQGALGTVPESEGWQRPTRLTPAQLRAVGSVRAWHPGLYRSLAASSAGVCLAFDTDATRVSLEVRLEPTPRGAEAVLADVARHPGGPRPPLDGLSADVDDRHLEVLLPDEKNLVTWVVDDPASAPGPGMLRLPGMGEPHRVRIWLPCLTACSVRHVVADGTYLEPVPERRALVVLGDSIAQGFVACDPGLSWPARLARHLDLDLLNQGIGGQVFQPGTVAGLAGRADAGAVVVEFGENYRYEPCQASRVEREVRAYLAEVAETFPDVPTWVLTCPAHTEDVYPTHPLSCAAAIDGIIRDAVARHPQMRLVNGAALLGDGDLATLLADGSGHPGPAGQELMAERLAFVMDATAEPAPERRARALKVARRLGERAFPLAECLGRGLGEVLLARRGAVVAELADGSRIVAGTERRLVREALACFGPAGGVTCVCGDRALARDVARLTGGHVRGCHAVVWRGGAPKARAGLDIRALTPAYAGVVRERYSHPEYLAPGELEAALARGAFLGGFEDGRIVGFVGEHADGSMGMLEVFEGHRREGWGTALTAAKVSAQLAQGMTPWAAVWPDNGASLALERRMGFEVRPADQLWFVS